MKECRKFVLSRVVLLFLLVVVVGNFLEEDRYLQYDTLPPKFIRKLFLRWRVQATYHQSVYHQCMPIVVSLLYYSTDCIARDRWIACAFSVLTSKTWKLLSTATWINQSIAEILIYRYVLPRAVKQSSPSNNPRTFDPRFCSQNDDFSILSKKKKTGDIKNTSRDARQYYIHYSIPVTSTNSIEQ